MKLLVEDRFDEVERELYNAVGAAIGEAGQIALAAVRASAGVNGYNLGPILSGAQLTGVERTSKGQGIWVIVPDFREIFFELGTYRRRRRSLKGARTSTSSQLGVKAGYMMSRAGKAAHVALPGLLERQMARIRGL